MSGGKSLTLSRKLFHFSHDVEINLVKISNKLLLTKSQDKENMFFWRQFYPIFTDTCKLIQYITVFMMHILSIKMVVSTSPYFVTCSLRLSRPYEILIVAMQGKQV